MQRQVLQGFILLHTPSNEYSKLQVGVEMLMRRRLAEKVYFFQNLLQKRRVLQGNYG